MKKNNIPFLLSALIFFLSLFAMACYLFSVRSEDRAFQRVREKLGEEIVKGSEEGHGEGPEVQDRFKVLYSENSDIIGWIKIDGTSIDYPVMYTPDDEQFYLHRDFDKNYSFGGCIFAGAGADIEGESDNIILYGHHMIDGSMFHDLEKYENEDFYKEHKYIKFDTLKEDGTYEVIAAFRTEIPDDSSKGFRYWTFKNSETTDDFEDFISNCKALSSFSIKASATYGDHLITLSTCAYHSVNGRFVVVAKRVG